MHPASKASWLKTGIADQKDNIVENTVKVINGYPNLFLLLFSNFYVIITYCKIDITMTT